MSGILIPLLLVVAAAVAAGGFFYWKNRRLTTLFAAREAEIKDQAERQIEAYKSSIEHDGKETSRRMYELAILKELGERTGYSLNVQNIVDVITGSLHQFIEYNAVSYMLLGSEKIIFKVHLEKSVSRSFVDDVKDRMLKSLSALMGSEYSSNQIEELLSGAILIDEVEEPVRSFFNIPLVIGEKVVGVLTVADTVEGRYKEEEMTILYKITKQASQAVTRLQEVVETEQRKLSSMVESMTEGVIMTDGDYKLLVVNPAAKRAIGLEEKKEVTIFDFIDNLGGAFDIRGRLEESVKLDKVIVATDVFIKDKFYQVFVSPVKNIGLRGEEILGGVVIFHDITHEKELQHLREDFISMMVHELRSPLGNVNKVLELMGQGIIKPGDKEYAEMIGMVSKGTSGMLELVNDLLDAAKLEAGKFEIFKEPADIKEIIRERLDFFGLSAKSAGLTIASVFASDTPEKLNIDSTRVAQVLNNLLSNAVKFTKVGGSITIQVFPHHGGQSLLEESRKAGIVWFLNQDSPDFVAAPDSVVVAVTDTGRGISQSEISQLFNKFKQFKKSNTGKSGEKGTGLGLAIAKGIVEAHNGRIGVASQEEKGSTFYFTLPL